MILRISVYTTAVFALFPSRTVAAIVFGFPIHWYGLCYLVAFLLAIVIVQRLQHWRGLHLNRDEWMSVVSSVVVGVLVGGRLGFVLFYEPTFFLAHPLKIFAVWEGGMASHGGFLGVIVAMYIHSVRHQIPKAQFADMAAVPAAIGLAFGRMGNFINHELYGTVSSLPWAMSIPGVEGLRHPLPLYDAALSLFIAFLCYVHLRMSRKAGTTLSLFFALYGVVRFSLEFVREQQYPLTDILGFLITRGQLLTVPIFVAGVVMMIVFRKNAVSTT
jgi:phosphatidylglycerol---prolipoprotein diacylglyceryl transferase